MKNLFKKTKLSIQEFKRKKKFISFIHKNYSKRVRPILLDHYALYLKEGTISSSQFLDEVYCDLSIKQFSQDIPNPKLGEQIAILKEEGANSL